MHLTTPRLTVTPLVEQDVEVFVRYRQDPAVARYQTWAPDYSTERARALVADQAGRDFPPVGEWLQYAVRTTAGETVGDVAIHALADQPATYELGVTMAPWRHRLGYAAEALSAVVDHLVTVAQAHRVFATCDDRNAAVTALLRRVGLRHEATLREADWFKDEWTTVQTWAVLAHEWAQRS